MKFVSCEDMKMILQTLRGVSTSANTRKTHEDRIKDSGTATKEDHIVAHPAIRNSPEAGRKALYVNVAHTEHFEGWDNPARRLRFRSLASFVPRPMGQLLSGTYLFTLSLRACLLSVA